MSERDLWLLFGAATCADSHPASDNVDGCAIAGSCYGTCLTWVECRGCGWVCTALVDTCFGESNAIAPGGHIGEQCCASGGGACGAWYACECGSEVDGTCDAVWLARIQCHGHASHRGHPVGLCIDDQYAFVDDVDLYLKQLSDQGCFGFGHECHPQKGQIGRLCRFRHIQRSHCRKEIFGARVWSVARQ